MKKSELKAIIKECIREEKSKWVLTEESQLELDAETAYYRLEELEDSIKRLSESIEYAVDIFKDKDLSNSVSWTSKAKNTLKLMKDLATASKEVAAIKKALGPVMRGK